ncbi:hypothetical protein NP493_521g00005 [Ridgeia piscesae]|uniref:Cytochrome b5 heme-binding domain-containing protein n=1 Tax=Ridgeia piscesae TaxID=27915 RepID=A0AAD9NQE4_RIDPI|nr:hypothetical protein NP493_521g00005 [Ridgeia piscesae]
MGKGALNHPNLFLQEYSWEEIRRHNTKKEQWIVIDGYVYDITAWSRKHPGGGSIIRNYAGEDASEAWCAFHTNKDFASKFLRTLVIGQVKGGTSDTLPIIEDFRKLRKTVEDMGLFKPSKTFFTFIMLHIFAAEFIGWFIMWYFGTGWVPFVIGACFLTIAQNQTGWSQHDYGHLSVLPTNRLNHWMHIFLINFMKGASSDWWNYRHNNHHAKPNVIHKDPDIRLDYLLLVGKVLPVEWGKKKKGVMPYNHQHWYFYMTLPPLLLPLYFNFEIPYYLIRRKRWTEIFWTSTFFLRYQLMFNSMLGFAGVFGLFMFVRFLESHWFVWATQMSHLPCEVDHEKLDNWVSMQLRATCNIEGSLFNDWFSGHLNYQIEHHLFPTMPRNNLCKAVPLVRSLCKKHNIPYICKPLWQGFTDIIGSLKASGEMWHDAYYK